MMPLGKGGAVSTCRHALNKVLVATSNSVSTLKKGRLHMTIFVTFWKRQSDKHSHFTSSNDWPAVWKRESMQGFLSLKFGCLKVCAVIPICTVHCVSPLSKMADLFWTEDGRSLFQAYPILQSSVPLITYLNEPHPSEDPGFCWHLLYVQLSH